MENQNLHYSQKLDAALTRATSEWFTDLSKAELLQFMSDRPQITADVIRGMLASHHVVLGFGVQFESETKDATAQFEGAE